MSNDIVLNTELNDKDEYFNFLFNKIDYDDFKIRNNFYKGNITKVNSYLSKINNQYLKKNIKLGKYNDESTKIKIGHLNKLNSLKLNLKLNQLKNSPYLSSKKLNYKKTLTNDKSQKHKKLNKHTKTHLKYIKILRGVLDKELYNEKFDKDKKRTNDKKNKTLTQRNINNISEKKNIEKNKINIVDSIKYGKSFINNCILRNKLIYDIKPLNKSNQKGKCYFPIEDNNNYAMTDRNIINVSNDIPIIANKLLNRQNKKIINKQKNNNIIKEYNFCRIKELREIPLNSLLSKDIPQHLKGPNLKTFYGRGSGDMIRGEQIKFIKTCYPVKFIKPLLTQKGYIIKTKHLHTNSFDKKIIKRNPFNCFETNSYNKKKTKTLIKNVNEELKDIKDKILKEFSWFDEQKTKLFNLENL